MTTKTTCMCRIPVHEAAIPVFASGFELAEWAKAHKVSVEPDHLGRPSVDVETAYRLRDEADEAAERHEKQRRADAERLSRVLAAAQENRQAAYAKAYVAAAKAGKSPALAGAAGREAIAAAEADLDVSIRNQLGAVMVPDIGAGFGFGFATTREV
jgi:hypothetical protein